MNSWDIAAALVGVAGGRSEVLAYHSQPVQVQYDHQEVLDGEEHQHLVEDVKVGHDSEPDHQERAVVDKQGLHDAPHVRTVLLKEGHLLDPWLILTVRLGVHHFVKYRNKKTAGQRQRNSLDRSCTFASARCPKPLLFSAAISTVTYTDLVLK